MDLCTATMHMYIDTQGYQNCTADRRTSRAATNGEANVALEASKSARDAACIELPIHLSQPRMLNCLPRKTLSTRGCQLDHPPMLESKIEFLGSPRFRRLCSTTRKLKRLRCFFFASSPDTCYNMESQLKKTTVTATATPVFRDYEVVAAEESGSAPPDRNVAAAIWAIVCGVALPCIPVIIISVVLMYFISHYQVIPRPGWPELQIYADHTHQSTNFTQKLHDARHTGGNPAYYVAYNPSTITTIASWTGRVIPYLSSSIMALVAFFAARRIVTKSKSGDGSDLPTPEQLTLLIGLLGGNSFGPLKDTVLHRWAEKKRLVDPIPFAFFALFLVTSVG